MGFEKMGRWARGMAAGMALGAEAGVMNTAEAAPQEHTAEKKDAERIAEFTTWVSEIDPAMWVVSYEEYARSVGGEKGVDLIPKGHETVGVVPAHGRMYAIPVTSKGQRFNREEFLLSVGKAFEEEGIRDRDIAPHVVEDGPARRLREELGIELDREQGAITFTKADRNSSISLIDRNPVVRNTEIRFEANDRNLTLVLTEYNIATKKTIERRFNVTDNAVERLDGRK